MYYIQMARKYQDFYIKTEITNHFKAI